MQGTLVTASATYLKNAMDSKRRRDLALAFELTDIGPQPTREERVEQMRQQFADKQTAANNTDIVKSQVVQARSILYNVRKNLHNHVANEGFAEEMGLPELFDLVDDIRERVNTRDTSKPAKRLGPVDVVPNDKIVVVDNTGAVATMLDTIVEHVTPSPELSRLYIQCDGPNLGRDGKLNLLLIYLPDQSTVYFVDVLTLGSLAFSTTSSRKDHTIKTILESTSITKYMWDCRASNDALFAHHHIKLDRVGELQLLDAVTKTSKHGYGLLDAATSFTGRMNVDEKEEIRIYELESNGRHAFKEGIDEMRRMKRIRACLQKGEPYDPEDDDPKKWALEHRVANGLAISAAYARPIEDDVMKAFWAQKVQLLPALHDRCLDHSLLTDDWAYKVQEETNRRLVQSRSAEWMPGDIDMAAPPADWGIKYKPRSPPRKRGQS